MATKLDSLLRNDAFLIWLIGGIGGVFVDIDHVPKLLGHEVELPFFGWLNVVLGISAEYSGRFAHSLFLVVACILIGYALACIGRRIEVGILGGGEK